MPRPAGNLSDRIETSSRRIPADSIRRTPFSKAWRSRVNPYQAPIAEDGPPPFATPAARAHARHQTRSPLPVHPERPAPVSLDSTVEQAMDFLEAKSFRVGPSTVPRERCDTPNDNPEGTAQAHRKCGDPADQRTLIRTTSITPGDRLHWWRLPRTTDPRPASARVAQ